MANTTKTDGKVLSGYYGGKASSGTYQTIINEIRPHHTYIEPFIGGGAIMLFKAKAQENIGIDLDKEVITQWRAANHANLTLHHACGIEYLEDLEQEGFQHKTTIYCDPPYPLESRKSQYPKYRHEMTDKDHQRLLDVLLRLNANHRVDLLISTYRNDLYTEALGKWHRETYISTTRQGPAMEWLFMNYTNEAGLLHDYNYLGKDYRERERIKKKINRHVARLQELPPLERNAILEALNCSTAKSGVTDGNEPFIYNAHGVCLNPEIIYQHQAKRYEMEITLCSDNQYHWSYGYHFKLKCASYGFELGGASMIGKTYASRQKAIAAATKHAREWITKAITGSMLRAGDFSHFYEWYNNTTQLHLTQNL